MPQEWFRKAQASPKMPQEASGKISRALRHRTNPPSQWHASMGKFRTRGRQPSDPWPVKAKRQRTTPPPKGERVRATPTPRKHCTPWANNMEVGGGGDWVRLAQWDGVIGRGVRAMGVVVG